MNSKSYQLFAHLIVLVPLVLTGCIGGTHVGDRYKGGAETTQDSKIEAEAFLFDCKYFEAGKKTSFRLEVYCTDSLAGLAGRGYLGKGALKGWLTADSLAVYFPTTGEYLYEPSSALLSGHDCADPSGEISFLQLFVSLPNLSSDSGGYNVSIDRSRSNRTKYDISHPGCDWKLQLEYDLREEGWRLKSFEFDDGLRTEVEGTRRTHKGSADIPQSRFQLAVPPESVRITL